MRIMSIQKDTKRVYKDFKLKNLGDYHDLNMQSNTLLLDVFESFHNKCHEIYELDPTHFLSAPGLPWQSCLQKPVVKLDLLININMLQMAKKGIRLYVLIMSRTRFRVNPHSIVA